VDDNKSRNKKLGVDGSLKVDARLESCSRRPPARLQDAAAGILNL
jgi:hypothetical protein